MKKTMTLLALLLGLVFMAGAAVAIVRPQQIDLSSSSSESAIRVTLSDYTKNDARYRIYNGTTPFYYCWNPSTDQFVTSNSYANGPQVLGTPTTTTTFWIPFQIGTNISTIGSYRDRFGPGYTANNTAVSLPSAVSIINPSTLTKSDVTFSTWSYFTEKHVILGYDASNNLISATSTELNSGNFNLVYESSTILSKIEVRTLTDNLIETVSLIPTTLSGTKTVGTGGNYATLALAIEDLTSKGISGAVTFNLTDATYDIGSTPLTIGSITGAGSTNTVTIKPATGVTASITGDVAGALIDLDGADFVTIDGLSGKLTINNTNIEGSVIAIKATSGYCTVTGTSITGSSKTGIEIYNAPHTSISKNKIFNLIGSGSNPLTGIYCEADETVAETNINNNMIILEGSTSSTLQGVQYNGTSDLSTLNLYNNSIYIGGMMQYTTNSFAFLKTGSAATINVKNNILYNKRVPLGIGKIPAAHQYAIAFRETSGNFTQDNNLFYSQEGIVGTYGFDVTSLLSDWQTASGLDANSQSSILTFEATAFANGELKYLRHADNAAVFNTGFNTGIATDFYGISRPQYGAYDIGAYELEASASLSETALPTVNTLAQNYPNPFNPATTIGFTLAKNAAVNLTVYNTKGEVVKSLINNSLNVGFHSVNFNAVGLNSGVYVYKLTTPDNSITKKMILLK